MIFIIVMLTSLLGSCTTYVLSDKFKFSKVLASAFPSLVVALFFKIFTILPDAYRNLVPVVFIGATFCGMTASGIIGSLGHICMSALLFGLLFSTSTLFFKGYGGGLGTIACVSVIVTTGIARGVEFLKTKKRIPE